MNKKNILLTIWLLLPITIVSLLMVWIFYSLDKDRLMADAPPVGAGAGDTGNANALGQWLAGRDADAVSRALEARREGRAIDPREWPGGIRLLILGPLVQDQATAKIELRRENELETILFADGLDVMGVIWFTLSSEQVDGVSIWLVQPSKDDRRIYTELQIPPAELQTGDPMVIEVQLDSVYEDSP